MGFSGFIVSRVTCLWLKVCVLSGLVVFRVPCFRVAWFRVYFPLRVVDSSRRVHSPRRAYSPLKVYSTTCIESNDKEQEVYAPRVRRSGWGQRPRPCSSNSAPSLSLALSLSLSLDSPQRLRRQQIIPRMGCSRNGCVVRGVEVLNAPLPFPLSADQLTPPPSAGPAGGSGCIPTELLCIVVCGSERPLPLVGAVGGGGRARADPRATAREEEAAGPGCAPGPAIRRLQPPHLHPPCACDESEGGEL